MLDVTIEVGHRGSVPQYAHAGDAGCDLCAAIESAVVIYPGARKLIPTQLKVDIPNGYELQVRPRSGLALNHGITVLNSPGTVDSGYRGEIGVILLNTDAYKPFTVEQGMKVAQGVFVKVERARFAVGELSDSERGTGGFGSTGVGYEY